MNEDQDSMFDDDEFHGNDMSRISADVDAHRWPRAMAELVDVFTAAAKREKVARDSDDAGRIGRWVVLTLGKHFGGRQVYLPKGDQLDKALRDNRIWQEFSGRNHEQLARRHGLTVVRVYKIIEQQRQLHRARVQPTLPLGDDNG